MQHNQSINNAGVKSFFSGDINIAEKKFREAVK
jgi:hypothetical protein